MKTSLYLVLALILMPSSGLIAQDKGTLAGARAWTVTKSEEAPPGTRILFSADGKLTITYVVDGKPRSVQGTYMLTGDKLILKLAHNGHERVETRTVKKLTDTVLVTEDKNRKLEELQRQ